MLSQREHQAAQTLFDYLTVNRPTNSADVIIGCGTYHLGAAVKAAALWHAGTAPYIIFTGYKNDRYEKTEAEMLRNKAIEQGVPAEAVFIEDKASNTGLNVTLGYQLAKEKGLLKTNRVLFVHKPYMSRRTYATAKAQWPDKATEIFTVPSDVTMEEYFQSDGTEQTIRSMLSDFHCIKAYPAKGWQIPQNVPAKAEEAASYLLGQGHLLVIPK